MESKNEVRLRDDEYGILVTDIPLEEYKRTSLRSSVTKRGETVTQIITATTGIKKTFRGVISNSIEQGQFTHFDTLDGRTVLVNDANVFCIEVFKEDRSPIL
jgi:hypothetical protein